MNAAQLPIYFFVALFIALFLLMISVALKFNQRDWKYCTNNPGQLIIAILLQTIGLPTLAYFLTFLFPLNLLEKTSIILISLAPGGVVSNYFSIRGHGNVVFSSIMTSASSFLNFLTLPIGLYLFKTLESDLLVTQSTSSNATTMLVLVAMTLLPFVLGFRFKPWLKQFINETLLDYLSGIAIVLLILLGLLKNYEVVLEGFHNVFFLIFLLNLAFLIFGYVFGLALGWSKTVCRTLSFELGVQNVSVILVLLPILAPQNMVLFNYLAFWGIWHLVAGQCLSLFWSKMSTYP